MISENLEEQAGKQIEKQIEQAKLTRYWDFIKQKTLETYGILNDHSLYCFCRANCGSIRYVDFKNQLENRI
jgi:hypothetical protein